MLIPPVVASLSVFQLVYNYNNSTKMLGEVVSCRSVRDNSGYHKGKITQKFIVKVVADDKTNFMGEIRYPSRKMCEKNIGNIVDILKNDKGKYYVYSFKDYFLPRIGFFVFLFFIYIPFFLIIKKYKN